MAPRKEPDQDSPFVRETEGHNSISLPAHVNTMKDCLLDFHQIVGLEAMMLVFGDDGLSEDDEAVTPLSAYRADAGGSTRSQRAQEREFLENAQTLSKNAERLEEGLIRNGDWRRLFQKFVRNRMDEADFVDSLQRGTLACAENEAWDTNLDPSRSLNTNPKPDLYFGFPVYNAEHQKSASFKHNPSLQNYTIGTLFQLAKKGLRSVPVSSRFGRYSGYREYSMQKQSHPLCFPWCIIGSSRVHQPPETREAGASSSETIHRASIAASNALALFEKLAGFADSKDDGKHIPPVVVVTSVQSKVTVWLAFSEIIDDQYRDHQMTNIWEGRISKTWKAIQFCRILQNLFSWSQHILKPMVTQYLEQWKLRHFPEKGNYRSRLEDDNETADLVHRIQDRLSSLNLPSGPNLPDLIQQAVVFQEVMRSSPKTPGPRSGRNPIPKVQCDRESSGDTSSDPKLDMHAAKISSAGALPAGFEKKVTTPKNPAGNEEASHSQRAKENGDQDYAGRSKQKPTVDHRMPITHPVPADKPLIKCQVVDSTTPQDQQAPLPKKILIADHDSQPMAGDLAIAIEKPKGKEKFACPREITMSDFKFVGRQDPRTPKIPSTRAFRSMTGKSQVVAQPRTSQSFLQLCIQRARPPGIAPKNGSSQMTNRLRATASKQLLVSSIVAPGAQPSGHGESAKKYSASSFQLSFKVQAWTFYTALTCCYAPPWYSARPWAPDLAKTSRPIGFMGQLFQHSGQVESLVPGYQRPEIPEVLPFKKKIPWKDRHIMVRLPPVRSELFILEQRP